MTSPLFAVLRHVGDLLTEAGFRWALVGGLAVSVRADPRFTRDIDLAVEVTSDGQAEALVRRLVAEGFVVSAALEHDVLRRLATVRLLPPGQPADGVIVDLLFASSGIEGDICRDAERLEIVPGVTVPVARAGHLLAQKILSRGPDRPQDEVDIQSVLADLDTHELERCRRALREVVARGANRGKDLLLAFEMLTK
jgi:DNA-binding MarR family transcriptional regulator